MVVHHENSNIGTLNLQQIWSTKLCGKLIFLSSARYIQTESFQLTMLGRLVLCQFYRDFIMPCLCQFTEILWRLVCVNLQRFYDALLVSIYRDFMMLCLCQFTEILWCPVCVNLQRFHNALLVSIYRDFMMPCLRQFTEIS